MRYLLLISSFTLLASCAGLKRVDNQCKDTVYMNCLIGKKQCYKDDKGCETCQCQL